MRTRTTNQAMNINKQVQFGLSGPDYITNAISGESGSNWNYNPGPSYAGYSRIVDESQSLRTTHSYRQCTHRKSTAAWFGNIVRHYEYSPPTPMAWCCYNMPFEYRPASLAVPSGPWADLVDQLASTVSGRLSFQTQLPVSLWEIGQTIRMVRNPFGLLKRTHLFGRKHRKLSARKLANAGANIWLEAYYGWKSAYQDVGSVAKALAHYLALQPVRDLEHDGAERVSVSSKTILSQDSVLYTVGTTESSWNYYTSLGFTTNFGTGAIARLTHVTDEVVYRVGCWQLWLAYQQIRSSYQLLRASGFDSSNWRDVRDLLWEVLPFSFVVDWFINTRGIWSPLNKYRLQQTDIQNVGYTTHRSIQYGVELYFSRPNYLYYATSTPWGYKIPTGVDGKILKSSSAGKISEYVRLPGFPPTVPVDSAFLARGLKRIQLLNAVSLLVQHRS